jgi:hypothetical protein
MQMGDIPVGHIATNGYNILYRGDSYAVYMDKQMAGMLCPIEQFAEDYEDLGKLVIDVRGKKNSDVDIKVV